MDRLYCTLQEIVDDLEQPGVRSESKVMRAIRAASQWIDQQIGWFMPLTEARVLDGPGGVDLWLPRPLLGVVSIVDDLITLTTGDYWLYPERRLWPNGPYDRVTISLDATQVSAWSAEERIITLTGRWGLYEESRATGATVATQTDSATSLVVDDGSKVSPGAVLLIGTEQELVEGTGTPTDSTVNTNEALTAEDEVLTVTDGSLVNIGEVVRVNFEQMKILDVSTNDLSVERGWNGTKRVSHLTAQDVYVYRTFTVKRGANGTTAASHTVAAISQYVAPDDVNMLARQMAGLLLKKAQSGWAGKQGNAELGEVFYLQEFPKEAIARIKSNYFYPLP